MCVCVCVCVCARARARPNQVMHTASGLEFNVASVMFTETVPTFRDGEHRTDGHIDFHTAPELRVVGKQAGVFKDHLHSHLLISIKSASRSV